MKLRAPKSMLIACLALTGAAWSSPVAAMPMVELLFVGHNGDSIAPTDHLPVAPEDTATLELWLTSDERGVSVYSVSVDFDSALTGRLLFGSASNILPAGLDFSIIDPRGPEDPLGEPGLIKHFTGATFDPDPVTESATFAIGTMQLSVTDLIIAGPVQISPFFVTGVDEIGSNELVLVGEDFVFEDVTADYLTNSITLSIVPEPSSAALLSLGLLVFGARRRGWVGEETRRPARSQARHPAAG